MSNGLLSQSEIERAFLRSQWTADIERRAAVHRARRRQLRWVLFWLVVFWGCVAFVLVRWVA